MNTVTVSYVDIALICLAAAVAGQIVLLAALAFCMGLGERRRRRESADAAVQAVLRELPRRISDGISAAARDAQPQGQTASGQGAPSPQASYPAAEGGSTPR